MIRVDQPIDIFLLAGQSNMAGMTPDDGGRGHPHSVFQWVDQNIIPATRPLRHLSSAPGHMGLDIEFAHQWRCDHPDHQIVFIPSAKGGTGFCDEQWSRGDPLYQRAVDLSNSLSKCLPQAHFRAILWHQGERDRHNPDRYSERLGRIIRCMREDIEVSCETTHLFWERYPMIFVSLTQVGLPSATR